MKTNGEKIKKFLSSISIYVLVIGVLSIPTRKGKNPEEENNRPIHRIEEPKINIAVNRKYDEKGPSIKFDSAYSSLFNDYTEYKPNWLISMFEHNYLQSEVSLFDKKFKYAFRTDSSFKEDFFRSDFFLRRYELNDAYLRNVMHEMDSIKNQFYWEYQHNID